MKSVVSSESWHATRLFFGFNLACKYFCQIQRCDQGIDALENFAKRQKPVKL
jgi:hypothetical protein